MYKTLSSATPFLPLPPSLLSYYISTLFFCHRAETCALLRLKIKAPSMNRRDRINRNVVHFAQSDDVDKRNSSDEEANAKTLTSPLRSPPPEPRPSPTSSGYSSDSTCGPLTPPNLPYSLPLDPKDTAYRRYGTPPTPAKKPKLAPVLVNGRLLRWDMASSPLNAIKKIPLDHDGGNDRAGCMPTGQPITEMDIIFDEALADWPLIIRAAIQGQPLTVERVWSVIHEHLMKLVSQEHFNGISPELKVRVRGAYAARSRDGSGLRRIDYMPSRMFVGLVARAGERGWQYHMACDNSE